MEKAKEQKVDLAGFIEPGTHRITHTHTHKTLLQLNTGLEAFHFTNNNKINKINKNITITTKQKQKKSLVMCVLSIKH